MTKTHSKLYTIATLLSLVVMFELPDFRVSDVSETIFCV